MQTEWNCISFLCCLTDVKILYTLLSVCADCWTNSDSGRQPERKIKCPSTRPKDFASLTLGRCSCNQRINYGTGECTRIIHEFTNKHAPRSSEKIGASGVVEPSASKRKQAALKREKVALKREKAALNSSLHLTMSYFTQGSTSQYLFSKFHLLWFTFTLFGHSH
jgi:hypothetical protein